MYNIINVDEEGQGVEGYFDRPVQISRMQTQLSYHELESGTQELDNVNAHYALKNDLIEHLWHKNGESTC